MKKRNDSKMIIINIPIFHILSSMYEKKLDKS